MVAKKSQTRYNTLSCKSNCNQFPFYSFMLGAEIAQLVEHFTRNEGVVGSSPIFSLLAKAPRKHHMFPGRLFARQSFNHSVKDNRKNSEVVN